MLWFPLALLTAFLNATEAALAKRLLSDLRPAELTAVPFLYAAPIMALVLLIIDIPTIQPGFWTLFLILLPVNIVGILLHFRAVAISPMSLTMPFLAFTPAFVLATGSLILGESVHPMGGVGVALIVAGGYVLGRDAKDRTLFGPIKALVRERGSLYMLAASFIYAFCAVLSKAMLLKSSPLFTASALFVAMGLLIPLILVLTGQARPRMLAARPGRNLLTGLAVCAHVLVHHVAISLVAAAYMMSIKRLSAIFSVLYGWLWFKEADIRYRLAGAALMSVGAAIIALWG